MDDYRPIEQRPDPANNQRSLMDLARHMREMLIEDKQKEQLLQQTQLAVNGSQYKKPVFMVNDMESTFLTLNKSLLYVGDNSTFQKRITWILAIQWISFSFMVNSMAYFFRSPNFSCRVPLTDIFYACSQTTACRLPPQDYRIIDMFNQGQISIVQEFRLYCGDASDVYQAEGLFFLGGFISGYILSYISERIGRRPVILVVLTFSILSILLCAWAPNFQIFTVSYFFTGCFLFGYETTVYIYISQISAMRFKTISINMLTMVWAGAPMFLALLSLIPTWRYSFAVFAVIWVGSVPFAYFCFLESPRFLLTKKCYSQVRSIFQKISITNRRPPYKYKLMEQMQVQNETFLRLKGQEREQSKLSQWMPQRKYNYIDLFRYNSVKGATLLLMYLWMFRFFMYFALNLALESVLQSGFMLTLAISTSSFSQVIGTFGIPIINFFFSRRYTSIEIIRKCVLFLSLFCGGLWMIEINNQCKVFEQSNKFCIQILCMIVLVNLIKFTNSIFFSALITYSSEVYPTVVRSLGYGFTLTFGRMSTFIVPFYINYMRSQYQNRNSLCFLAPFGIIGFLFCLLMPDTTDMKETIPQQDEEIRANRDQRQIEMKPIRSCIADSEHQPKTKMLEEFSSLHMQDSIIESPVDLKDSKPSQF